VASRDVAVFLMLWQWRKADKWEDVSHVVQRGHVWCIKIYSELFILLFQYYRGLVQVLDYQHNIPLLVEWSDRVLPFHHVIIDRLDVQRGFNMRCILTLLPYICSNVLDITIHARFKVIEPAKIQSE
jgi:hypothetical protein